MTSGHGPHTSATISDVVLTSPWVLSVCVGEQWVSCNSKSLCAGVLGPCHVALLSRSACRKCLLLHLRVLASRMPMELFVNLPPPLPLRFWSLKPAFLSSCCPAVCCSVTLFQARLQRALQVFCLTSPWVSALLSALLGAAVWYSSGIHFLLSSAHWSSFSGIEVLTPAK